MKINPSKQPKIAGILLAAGNSARMGQPKALLDFDGSAFIDKILDHLHHSGCDPILSILGESGDMICNNTTVNSYECYSNPHPEQGMLSSLKIAIENLPTNCDGFILALVDHPAVKEETYQKLVEAAGSQPGRIIIPTFFGKKGHPVYFGKQFFNTLLNAPEDLGARIVVQQQIQDVHFLKVEDEGILYDIDTPDDFEKWAH